MSGHFIAFEGGEGVGKSTQIARAAEWLRAAGLAGWCSIPTGR
jgi:dTMP kinase